MNERWFVDPGGMDANQSEGGSVHDQPVAVEATGDEAKTETQFQRTGHEIGAAAARPRSREIRCPQQLSHALMRDAWSQKLGVTRCVASNCF